MIDLAGIILILLAVYSIASTAGIFAERSGTINLSIDGTMIIAAAFYIMTAKLIVDGGQAFEPWVMFVAMLVGCCFGMIFNTLLSFAAINLRGNQVVVGTALNILAPIISLIVISLLFTGQITVPNEFQVGSFAQNSPLETWAIQIIMAVIVMVVVAIFWVVQKYTVLGLRMRAAGENPFALDAAGVSVFKTRHIAMLMSGFLASMAGVVVLSGYSQFSSYSNNLLGIGFMAIAILIIGQWRIHWAILGAAVFSVIYGLVWRYSVNVGSYSSLIFVVPYVVTIIGLPTISRFARQPKADGIPYVNTGR